MHERIQEFCDLRGSPARVDRATGVLRGGKVLGAESRNGRVYRREALEAARPLYEGAKVNVNHPKSAAAATRDYQDRIGVLRAVEYRHPDGLFAELHYNPKHALAEQLAWDAEHLPENVGLSHHVEARVTRSRDAAVVEAITKVLSVDLVADPATTRGLFEAAAAATSVETESLELAARGDEPLETSADDRAAAAAMRETSYATRRPALAERIERLSEDIARLERALERTAEADRARRRDHRPQAREQRLVEHDHDRRMTTEEFVRAIRPAR